VVSVDILTVDALTVGGIGSRMGFHYVRR